MGVLEIFSFIFHFPVLFFIHRPLFWLHNHTSGNSDGHRWYQTYFPWDYQSFSHFTGACFFKQIKVLHALLWDLKFSTNWGKKWAPTNITNGLHFSTIAQPFPIFKKLLAIIPNIQNHPHVRILDLKINTNTKSPVLLTQLVLQCQTNCNTNTIIVILSHKKNREITYRALFGNYWKVFFVLGMYVLLNQVAFFIASKSLMR